MSWVKINKAAEFYGVHVTTVRKYAENGHVKSKRTATGRWMFDIGEQQESKSSVVCYCRVSSRKQQDDLVRQVSFMQEQFPKAEIIKDIGSGLNYKRPGLNSILDRLLQGEKLTVVVAHKDRLGRFGTDIIKYLINKNGGEFLVLDRALHSPEEELTKDLLSILTVFSCRMHGLRRYTSKIKEDKNLSE
jgi:predicted site-specific integrase-resolvase